MLLNHIEKVTPLRAEADLGVLVNWPLETKIVLCSHAIDVFFRGMDNSILCHSVYAVGWAMEIIGEAFSLPIKQADTIKQAVSLYSKWLRLQMVPKKFLVRRILFSKRILGHMSLIFEPRSGLSESEQRTHIEICRDVIDIFEEVLTGESQGISSFSDKKEGDDFWEYSLNVILGIADRVISEKNGETYLAHNTAYILKMLFNSWMASKTRDPVLWNRLTKLFAGWLHREEAVHQWNSTVFAFTSRVVNIIYNGLYGSKDISIVNPFVLDGQMIPVSEIHFDDDSDVIFFWHKFIRMVGDLNETSIPSIFLNFMMGVSDTINLFLNIGENNEGRRKDHDDGKKVLPRRPRLNSVLNIFGDWLFDAVRLARKGFEEGTNTAFSILCRVFSRERDGEILPIHTARFYKYLIIALENETRYGNSICTILKNSQQLFQNSNLVGSYVMIPAYLFWVNKILVSNRIPKDTDHPLSDMRSYCISILTTLVPIPVMLDDVEIMYPSYAKKKTYKRYGDMTATIVNTFIKGFENERNHNNIIQLINGMVSALFQYIDRSKGFGYSVVFKLQRFLCNPADYQEKWPIVVKNVALNMLEALIPLIPKIHEQEPQVLTNLVSSLSEMVSEKAKLIEPQNAASSESGSFQRKASRINIHTAAESDNLELVVYNTISLIKRLVMGSVPWIYDSKKTTKDILSMIRVCLEVDNEDIVSNAQDLFYEMYNNFGNFPLSLGPSVTFSTINEFQLREMYKGELFAMSDENSRIATLFEFEDKVDKRVIMIVRSAYGKTVWSFRIRPIPLSERYLGEDEIEKYQWSGKPRAPIYPQHVPQDPMDYHEESLRFGTDLLKFDYFSATSEIQWSCIAHVAGLQFRNEEVYRYIVEETVESDYYKIAKPGGIDYSEVKDPTVSIRMLLINLGFTKISGLDGLRLLRCDDELLKNLGRFDLMTTRREYTVGIYYAPPMGRDSTWDEKSILSLDKGSPEYEMFLKQMGWPIELKTHKGYTGNMHSGIAKETYYYSDTSVELVYHVSTMINGETETDIKVKRTILGGDSVLIVWVDGETEPDMSKILTPVNKVIIFIQPVRRRGGRIFEIHLRTETSIAIGPLSERCTVTRESLGDQVRTTALIALQELERKHNYSQNQIKKRQSTIRNMIEKFDMKLANWKKMSSLF